MFQVVQAQGARDPSQESQRTTLSQVSGRNRLAIRRRKSSQRERRLRRASSAGSTEDFPRDVGGFL